MLKKIYNKFINNKTFIQFIKFTLIGGINTLLDWGIYSILVYYGMPYFFAQAISFVLSVLSAFFLNTKFVFKNSDESKWKRLLKTYISYGLTGLLLSLGLLTLFIEVFHINEYVSKLLTLFVTTPTNFLLNKFWSMKESKIVENEEEDVGNRKLEIGKEGQEI